MEIDKEINKVTNVRLSDDEKSVIIIDQTLLPGDTKFLKLQNPPELFEAIFMLRVRGAPAIGIFAAYALYVLACQITDANYDGFLSEISRLAQYLNSARPTAVNLSTQLYRIENAVKSSESNSIPQILEIMKNEAISIQNEDIIMCKTISEYGLSLIQGKTGNPADNTDDVTYTNNKKAVGIMTQCNAGPLATSLYGTALGPILLGHSHGLNIKAYINETRPLLQGSRLTAYELNEAGVDCTLICDNMASIVMKQGRIDAVFAGCDRIAKNGDTANKIGTNGLAILAKYYNIPFYIFGPSTTIDYNCERGADIEIELRSPQEIKELFFNRQVAPKDVNCYNPSFDVTDAELITAIVTEKGIFRYPYYFTNS